MRDISDLWDGYQRFLDQQYSRHRELYRSLAESGQAPKTMVIACCDSRVEPAVIFDAQPGQLFIVRNVANLVPPYEPFGDYHGTSAALEFAVNALKVENIVIMGHAQCGGVHAFLKGQYGASTNDEFIAKWMSLLRGARGEALKRASEFPEMDPQQLLEQLSICHSLENLNSFPFIKEAVKTGALSLHGAYFTIATGKMFELDQESRSFHRVGSCKRDDPVEGS